MSRVRELGVWLHGERVAELRAPRIGRVTSEYTTETLERFEANVPLLSCSLPLLGRRADAWPFATGLLPEGQHRQAMADKAKVTTIDLLGMLAKYGRDVAGAVVISADDPPIRDPDVALYSADDLAAEVRELDDHPLGLHDDSELSIAGLQDKTLLVKTSEGWARPLRGYPSTHILKLDDRLHPGLVHAEHACLLLAQRAGIRAASSELVTVGGIECIAVERFDRHVSDGEVTRVHQEDACQALGIDPDSGGGLAKYERNGGPRLRQIADLLDRWGTPTDLDELLRQVVFTVVIGNADAHGKNIALLHPSAETIALAPLYDTVPTVLWPSLRRDAAMSVNGVTDLGRITAADIAAEAAAWARPTGSAEKVAMELETLGDAVDSGALDATPELAKAVVSRLLVLRN